MTMKLRKYLDDNLMTDSYFCRLVNINRTTLWRVMSNGKPSRVTALKIQRATDGKVPITEFGYSE